MVGLSKVIIEYGDQSSRTLWESAYEKGYADAKKQFERPKGKWVLMDKELSRYQCPKCGEIIRLYKKNEIRYLDRDETINDYPFSHCGLDMRDGE